jgi:predicted membrane-bound spermidine synthase
MLIELSLMQRMTLYLGSPLLAASLVLATVLIGAGIGSRLSDRWWPATRSPAMLFPLLGAVAALTALALPPLLTATIGLPFGTRLALTSFVVLAIGILLGMPLPIAMTRLGSSLGAGWVGRAWAANGVGSVLGPVLAAIVSIDLGLSTTTLVGGLLYLFAYLTLGPLWRPAAP